MGVPIADCQRFSFGEIHGECLIKSVTKRVEYELARIASCYEFKYSMLRVMKSSREVMT